MKIVRYSQCKIKFAHFARKSDHYIFLLWFSNASVKSLAKRRLLHSTHVPRTKPHETLTAVLKEQFSSEPAYTNDDEIK